MKKFPKKFPEIWLAFEWGVGCEIDNEMLMKLLKYIMKVEKDNARLKTELEKEYQTLHGGYACGWCNTKFESLEETKYHGLSCDKNPLVKRIAELEDAARWHKTEEELPETESEFSSFSIDVELANENTVLSPCWYDFFRNNWHDNDGKKLLNEFPLWRPIQHPIKSEDGDK